MKMGRGMVVVRYLRYVIVGILLVRIITHMLSDEPNLADIRSVVSEIFYPGNDSKVGGYPLSTWKLATTSCPSVNDMISSRNHSSFRCPEDQPDPSINEMLREAWNSRTTNMTIDSMLYKGESCRPTSQIELVPKCPFWELKTFDDLGNAKSVAGDEFYVTYTDDLVIDKSRPSAVALITSIRGAPGTYQLEFVSSPMNHRHHRMKGSGTVTIILQYTCGLGAMFPPEKLGWNNGANTVVSYSLHVEILPPIRRFAPSFDHAVDMSLSKVTPVGDSMMQLFMTPRFPRQQNPNLSRAFNSTTLSTLLKRFENPEFKTSVQISSSNSSNNLPTILITSHAWDILEADNTGQDIEWTDHIEACRTLLLFFKQMFRGSVNIVWKGTTPMHVHVPMIQVHAGDTMKLAKVIGKNFLNRLFYMSESRSRLLHEAQKKLMESLHIPYLDIYEAAYLSADHTYVGDGRHFLPTLNSMWTNWFFSKYTRESHWDSYREGCRDRYQSALANPRRKLVVGSCDVLTNTALVGLALNKAFAILDGDDGCAFALAKWVPTIRAEDAKEMDNLIEVIPNATKMFWGMEELQGGGYLNTAPENENAQDVLRQKEEDVLHGMFIDQMLNFGDDSELTTSSNLEQVKVDSDDGISIGIRVTPSIDMSSLEHHMNETLKQNERYNLPCHVWIFGDAQKGAGDGSHSEAEEFLSGLGCSAHSIEGQTSLDMGIAQFISTSIHDAYLTECNSLQAQYTTEWLHYLRDKHARKMGQLPVDPLPIHCLDKVPEVQDVNS